MQIGEKVRFLNEVGGGVITGFQGKDIVLVQDEDGFDIPMLRSQVVVIETNANNFQVKKKPEAAPKVRILDNDAEGDPSQRPVTYQPKPQERRGGDLLNVCLAFVPENSRELTDTRFEAYLINDSNYYVHAIVANNEGTAWQLRWQGIIEPNTKQLLETFDRSRLNDLERLCVQLVAWKQDKPFLLKPAVDVALRLDMVKFYKLHVFRPSPFFREPALVYDIVRDDRPIKQVFVDAEEVLDAMRGDEPESAETDSPEPVEVRPAREQADSQILPPEGGEETAAPRTRDEEREALKAAKRALKAELRAQREKEKAEQREKEQQRREEGEILEIDLHINALLDHTEGLSPNVLLNTQLTEFRIIMERNIRKRGQRIVFIHGKGNDVLRDALIKELRYRYRTCTYSDASFQKYGYGATMVTIG